MVFMMLDPRQKKSGSTLENVAEEMLNGLFCHYEPPTSEYAQHKAATELKANPAKYISTPTARSKKSILRTSRLFRKKVTPKAEATATAAAPAKKGVTWRDEQTQPGIEGRVVACAIDQCDFFGISTRVGGGLADSLSPTAGTVNPFPEPAVYQEMRSAENEATPQVEESRDEDVPAAEPAGKVLYDDEGNPISINTDSDPTSDALAAMDDFECAPRTARKAATEEVAREEEEAYHHRSVPSGYSQVRKLAMQFERGEMYEPLNYDQPKKTAQSLAYRRVRSPPVHKSGTPRGGAYESDNEDVDLAAPSGLTSVHGRPSTPYRRRTFEESGRDDKGRMGFESPGRRSDVYSDLTMDDALTGRGRYSYRFPQSPAKPSEGIEVDMYHGRARPHSKSPSHYRSQTPKDHYAPFPQAHSRIRDGRVGMGALADDASREPMEDEDDVEDVTPAVNSSRRHSTSEYNGTGTRVEQRPIKMDRLRRVSAPLPGMQDQSRSSNPVDAVIRELEHKVRLRSTMTKVSEAIKELESKNRKKYDAKRPIPPKKTPAAAAPAPSRRNRDPTPRRSLEPSMEDMRPQGLLPPTPKRKDGERRDTFNSRGAEVPSKPTTTTTNANAGYINPYNKSYSKPEQRKPEQRKPEQKSEYPRPAQSHSRPVPIESSKVEAGTYEKTVRKYRQPFSPSSVATDDEIRAEVTSVGVTDTPKAFSRFSSPYHQIPATVTDDSAERENSQPNKSSRKRDKKGDAVPAESAGSGSARSKLVKGFKKAVGKMKEIVKDIDDSRIDLDPHHPGHAKQGSSKSKRSHSTKRSAKRQ